MKKRIHVSILILCFIGAGVSEAFAQLERTRANPDRPVRNTFWAPSLIGLSTVDQIQNRNLEITIMHAFGIATDGVENFYGLDDSANIRLGLDYGITDRWSLGVGRTRFDKVVDIRTKYQLLQQTVSGSIPVSVSAKASTGITTLKNGFSFDDRLSYSTSLLIARKFTDRLSLQLSPVFAHFNTVNQIQESSFLALGIAGSYELNRRVAITGEYLPVLSEKNPGTKNHIAFGFDIDTGGHVFQLFFTTTQWFDEQFIISRNRDEFFSGDFRFGFNVNRSFSL